MEDDWDLHAVVRSCCATTSAASTTTAAAEQDYMSFSATKFQDLFELRRDPLNSMELDLHDLCKPFLISQKKDTISLTTEKKMVEELPQQTQFQQKQQPFSVLNLSKPASSHHPSSRSKKRKNSLKKVCHVAAENLSSDMWSWRKYGQKPIKGSPYPRGYYRCSTSKGCLARKQVERNRSDPGMFIVTYTAEHNHPMPTHRNSLAGSTRLKASPETPNSDEPKKPVSSSEMSPAAAEKPESSRDDTAEDMDDDDGFSGSNAAAADDDFFSGLEDFAAEGVGECFSGRFAAAGMQFPWLAGGAAAATAAGGG